MTGTLNHDPTTPAASYDAYTRASAPSGETTVAVAASPAQAPTPRHTLPVAIAAPATRTTATFFDPWNSSSTGHQRAENRLSTSSSWRVSRSLKLREQFKAGRGGGKRVADTVGAGRDDAAPNARKPDGQKSLAEVWRASKTAKRPPSQENDVGTVAELTPCASGHNQTYAQEESHAYSKGRAGEDGAAPLEKQQLFVGLCFYLNGSTAPLVSDHSPDPRRYRPIAIALTRALALALHLLPSPSITNGPVAASPQTAARTCITANSGLQQLIVADIVHYSSVPKPNSVIQSFSDVAARPALNPVCAGLPMYSPARKKQYSPPTQNKCILRLSYAPDSGTPCLIHRRRHMP
ncbi:uncharacterized protein SETTUDRAFT_31976 [Exserohilum turcica Et28A]|uniref:Uncharacterized protein n=1 Tax=Exserohilum turcicum (strain 28A) TaxID=671987 RepID=R0K8Z4_EXST2|nr:uncharacterized protein SETTUDRAFT_31976 [Exserohilum turcica Et28A]EOA84732.1 hypothetical protein SETTUDRAFT_31976 [Exserohilum turcica Et28A]